MRNVIKILHLSDLQAGSDCLAECNDGPLNIEDSYKRYADKLVNDVSTMLNGDIPDILVLSGDIASKGQPHEYDYASIFLQNLTSQLKISPNNIVIVPGNHDVNWALLEKNYKKKHRGAKFNKDICASMEDKMFSFQGWLNQVYPKKLRYNYSLGNPIVFNKIQKPQILVVGLDSCERITYRRQDNIGSISIKQVGKACKYIEKNGKDKINIVVMHHNPFPFDNESSCLKASKPILKMLDQAGVHLILAGHMHKAIKATHETGTPFNMHTLTTGPCYLKPKGRTFPIQGYKHQEVFPNRYQLLFLDLTSKTVTALLRRFSFERMTNGTFGNWTYDADPEFVDFYGSHTLPLPQKGIVKPLHKKISEEVSQALMYDIIEKQKLRATKM